MSSPAHAKRVLIRKDWRIQQNVVDVVQFKAPSHQHGILKEREGFQPSGKVCLSLISKQAALTFRNGQESVTLWNLSKVYEEGAIALTICPINPPSWQIY